MHKPVFRDTAAACTCTQSSGRAANRCSSAEGNQIRQPFPDQPAGYIGGLLNACPSFLASPTPPPTATSAGARGFEAPVNLVYYPRAYRSAAVRIPLSGPNRRQIRLESQPVMALAIPTGLHASAAGPPRGIRQPIYDPGGGHRPGFWFELTARAAADSTRAGFHLKTALRGSLRR